MSSTFGICIVRLRDPASDPVVIQESGEYSCGLEVLNVHQSGEYIWDTDSMTWIAGVQEVKPSVNRPAGG